MGNVGGLGVDGQNENGYLSSCMSEKEAQLKPKTNGGKRWIPSLVMALHRTEDCHFPNPPERKTKEKMGGQKHNIKNLNKTNI